MYGVAIIIQKRHVKSLINWTQISDRLIKARFQSWNSKLSVIQCYAPTNDKKQVNNHKKSKRKDNRE